MDFSMLQDPKKQRSKTKKTKTQDYLPEIDIKNGVIIADGNYIKVLEVTPLNFRMKSPEEQAGIISRYADWIKIAPDNFCIKCIPKKIDIEHYIGEYEKIPSSYALW